MVIALCSKVRFFNIPLLCSYKNVDIKLKHSTKIPYEELQINLDLGDD